MTQLLCTNEKRVADFVREKRIFGKFVRRDSDYGEGYHSPHAKLFLLNFSDEISCAAQIGALATRYDLRSLACIASTKRTSLALCHTVSDGQGSYYYPDMPTEGGVDEIKAVDRFLFCSCRAASCFLPPHRIFCFVLGTETSQEDAETLAYTMEQSTSQGPKEDVETWMDTLKMSQTVKHALRRKIYAYYARHHRLALAHWTQITSEHKSHLPLFEVLDT